MMADGMNTAAAYPPSLLLRCECMPIPPSPSPDEKSVMYPWPVIRAIIAIERMIGVSLGNDSNDVAPTCVNRSKYTCAVHNMLPDVFDACSVEMVDCENFFIFSRSYTYIPLLLVSFE